MRVIENNDATDLKWTTKYSPEGTCSYDSQENFTSLRVHMSTHPENESCSVVCSSHCSQ